MFRNMTVSLINHERIETTLHKAKELRSYADHMITLGKKNSLWAKRQAFDFVRCHQTVAKLFNELAPRFKARNGGYTRVLKTGFRFGDSAEMALIEYLDPVLKAVKPVAPKKEKSAEATAAAKEAKAAKKAAKPAKKEKAEPKKEKVKKEAKAEGSTTKAKPAAKKTEKKKSTKSK